MIDIVVDTDPGLRDATYDRMCEILQMITPTIGNDPEVEYSALFSAGALCLCVRMGLEANPENVQTILRCAIASIIHEFATDMEKGKLQE